jgi:hypothetical protein
LSVPSNESLQGNFLRDILDARLNFQDAKLLHSQEILYEKTDQEKLPTDSPPYLSPTKRMIVEENGKKRKIYFCAGSNSLGRALRRAGITQFAEELWRK